MLEKLKQLFTPRPRDQVLQERLERLRQHTPNPVFWLFGKTQSGKTTLVRFLTGADDAEIGLGFRPCTRFSRMYQFPTEEAPLLTFLDTRGVDEPGYDAEEDIARFDEQAHVVVVTIKVMDHAQETLLDNVRKIRRARSGRPLVLVLTCLHEAYPQQQHLEPYPFANFHCSNQEIQLAAGPAEETANAERKERLENLLTSIREQCRRFGDLVDAVVPLDITPPQEGFTDPNYGGDALKQTLIETLPGAYRQTLIHLDEATHELQDLYAQQALPHILAYSSLAATAGAIPIPWLDLLVIPGIQTRMIYALARFYGQPLSAQRFLELAGSLGIGVVFRQAVRETVKFIPIVGSITGYVLAGASTFALGKAFCYYYSAVHRGHVPNPDDLRHYYQEQLAKSKKHWAEFRKHQHDDPVNGNGHKNAEPGT